MNSTSPSSRFVRIAARSPARSSAGPLVIRQRHVQLRGDDAGERRLAEPGWTREQQVVDGLAASHRGPDHDLEVLLQPGLADELGEPARPQRRLLGRLHRIRVRAQQLLSHGRARSAARAHGEELQRVAEEILDRSRRRRGRASAAAHLVGAVAEAR